MTDKAKNFYAEKSLVFLHLLVRVELTGVLNRAEALRFKP
jgi:hypothetical protein